MLAFFPGGSGKKPSRTVVSDNKNVLLTALRKENDGTLIRLYNSARKPQRCNVNAGGREISAELAPFEVKTYIIDGENISETNMLGERN